MQIDSTQNGLLYCIPKVGLSSEHELLKEGITVGIADLLFILLVFSCLAYVGLAST